MEGRLLIFTKFEQTTRIDLLKANNAPASRSGLAFYTLIRVTLSNYRNSMFTRQLYHGSLDKRLKIKRFDLSHD